MTQKMYSLSLF